MIKWNQELTLVVVHRVWQHAPATAAYPQSWGTVPMLHYGVRMRLSNISNIVELIDHLQLPEYFTLEKANLPFNVYDEV